jgi:3-phosphoshikimate 1-carboxyvinyltransferase
VLLTCDWLNRQGIVYQNEGLKKISIKGSQTYKCFDSPIPADFSSATFFLCGAAILDGDITVHGLDFTDSQPDKAVVDYLSAMGARIERLGDSLRIRGGMLKGIEIDMNKTPDALPAMAVVGAFAAGTTSLVNVPQARCKETDRIACMAAELKKMGARIEELPDGLVIHQSTLTPAALDGHYDHRIVMALAVAAMAVNGVSSIASAEAMSVTFPTFVELMTALGANMELVDH